MLQKVIKNHQKRNLMKDREKPKLSFKENMNLFNKRNI